MVAKRTNEEKNRISLFDIIKDETLHARAETNNEVVMALTKIVTKGEKLPPIVVFFDEEHYWLADGFYRYEAHMLAGRGTISAIIHQGGRKEALFHALKSNVNHGLRRSNADKWKAVTIALTDPDVQGMSDNEIAKICKVSQPFVSKIRRILTYNGFKFDTTRVCADGRIMDTSKIGTTNTPEHSQQGPPVPEVKKSGLKTKTKKTALTKVTKQKIAVSKSATPKKKAPKVENGNNDNDSGTSDIDRIEDVETLKLMIAEFKDTTKIQEKELKVKDNEIIELENLVKELEAYSLYLEKQLEAHLKVGTDASASLDINSMDEEPVYSMA